MPEFEPLAILSVLAAHRVSCIVIGGWAARSYGSPLLTTDIDVVPDLERDNMRRLSEALCELDAKARNGEEEPLPFAHDATSLASAAFWNLTTKYGDLDISLCPSGTEGYPDLRAGALHLVVEGVTFDVASLADVIRSKEAAGRDKDRRALPILRELLAEQLRRKRGAQTEPS
ncbi:MAG: hypothetical protein M3P04_05365 [Actinomycetota bacterium]|nr:hypothetical protein [Actinomycetota bacterium]